MILCKKNYFLYISQNFVHPFCFLQSGVEEAQLLHPPAAQQPPVLHHTSPPQGPCSPPPLDSAIGLPPLFVSLSLFQPLARHLTQTKSLIRTRNWAVPLQCKSFHHPCNLQHCLLKNSALQGSWLTYLGLEHSKDRWQSSRALWEHWVWKLA